MIQHAIILRPSNDVPCFILGMIDIRSQDPRSKDWSYEHLLFTPGALSHNQHNATAYVLWLTFLTVTLQQTNM